MTITLSDQTANDVLRTETRPVLVDFWSARCETCRLNAAVADSLRLEFGEAMVLAKVNVEACPYTVAEQQVALVPCLMLFKDGRRVAEYPGTGQGEAIRAALAALCAPAAKA